MCHTDILQLIRTTIKKNFVEFGASTDAGVRESILLRDDCYCGRRFAADGLQAVWFIEEDELKFYSESGSLLHVCAASDALREPVHQLHRAA